MSDRDEIEEVIESVVGDIPEDFKTAAHKSLDARDELKEAIADSIVLWVGKEMILGGRSVATVLSTVISVAADIVENSLNGAASLDDSLDEEGIRQELATVARLIALHFVNPEAAKEAALDRIKDAVESERGPQQ